MSEDASGRVLSSSVLVLNRFYMAVHVISVRRAFVLLYRDLAEVVHIENGQYANYDFAAWCEISQFASLEPEFADTDPCDWIRTVKFSIQVPRVVRLLTYDRVPRHSMRFNRRTLFARDDHRCQYCGQSRPPSQLSIDHVLPRSRGGKTTWENVVCSCLSCNTKKGSRTPQEARMNLLRPPHKPRHNPLLTSKMNQPKYEIWRSFIGGETTNALENHN
ncbi:MAG: HNH endonuclease [Planctomycetales bacterium]|nr:HNH endonuclease [Planctomycetales bacterium]